MLQTCLFIVIITAADQYFKRQIKSHRHLLTLLGAHHILHVSRIRAKLLAIALIIGRLLSCTFLIQQILLDALISWIFLRYTVNIYASAYLQTWERTDGSAHFLLQRCNQRWLRSQNHPQTAECSSAPSVEPSLGLSYRCYSRSRHLPYSRNLYGS